MTSSLTKRSNVKGSDAPVSSFYDPLAVLDEAGGAEPLDTAGE
jgi:hypothetical protein